MPYTVAPKTRERHANIDITREKNARDSAARAQGHNLAKVGVEGSNPFARSRTPQESQRIKSDHWEHILIRVPSAPTNLSKV